MRAWREPITALALDPARLERLASAESGLSRYDWNNLADEHIALYRTCLAGQAAAHPAKLLDPAKSCAAVAQAPDDGAQVDRAPGAPVR